MFRGFVLILVFSFAVKTSVSYEVPPAKLEAIYPKGLRVSIPGICLFIEMIGLLVYWFFIISKENKQADSSRDSEWCINVCNTNNYCNIYTDIPKALLTLDRRRNVTFSIVSEM